jgi:N-acetylmuramoyl-L-alanine amidase
LLAENIKLSIKSLLQPDNKRECKKADNGIYLLKNAKNPSIIVECGFISNNEECTKLLDETYQKQMAFSIVAGFLNYENSNL